MAGSPTKIGRFTIESELGRGSMGIVYRAHDPQLDRAVAIKTIHQPEHMPAARVSQWKQNLLNEARLVAQLSHPGIVQVFDAGEFGGEPYMVMELINGQPLSEMMTAQGRMAPEFSLKMFQRLLEAMAYAHDQNVIHRDLKPGNIMIQSDGRPKVMDFGIARVLNDEKLGKRKIAGTPRYMSPEQLKKLPLETSSDVYALGVILYEMLAGRKPFEQTEFKVLFDAVTSQPHPSLDSYAPDLRVDIYTMVDRALRKEPEQRYPSARQMLEEFDRLALVDDFKPHNAEKPQPGTEQGALGSEAQNEIIKFIMKRIERKGDFPATQQYIAQIAERSSSQNSSAQNIAECILKDFSLTNRILRMVNSPYYSGRGQAVTTISRAVVILGIDTIMNVASGLTIFEHFYNRTDLPELKNQTIQALMTALHAKELACQQGMKHAEEAFICGMLHHLGKLIVAFYFPEEHEAIQKMLAPGGVTEAQASRKIMRVSYSELGQGIARTWNLPDNIQEAMKGEMPADDERIVSVGQKLSAVVAYAEDLSKITMIPDENQRAVSLQNLATRHKKHFHLKPRQLEDVTKQSVNNALDISHALRVDLGDLGLSSAPPDEDPRQESETESLVFEKTLQDDQSEPSLSLENPFEESVNEEEVEQVAAQRQDFLMKAIGEITNSLMGEFELNDILMMVIEGIYRGVGFDQVILSLVNTSHDKGCYRFGLGDGVDTVCKRLEFPLDHSGGLMALSVREGKEIFLADIDAGNYAKSIPGNLVNELNIGSVLLLPLIVQNSAIGLFSLFRSRGRNDIKKQELLTVRTLVNQANLALMQSLKNK